MKKTYDFIIAGGGCAGQSMLYYLLESTLKHKSILIVDKEEKQSNDRTWCYWTKTSTAFSPIVFKRWSSLSFADDQGAFSQSIHPWRYEMLRSSDFYALIQTRIRQFPNVDVLKGTIQKIACQENQPFIQVDGIQFSANWIFDSCYHLASVKEQFEQTYFFQLQHFQGWVIETPEDSFCTDQAMLMDFRTPQQDDARFFYILPFSSREALVEYTIFSAELLNSAEYTNAIKNYISNVLQLSEYKIREKEYGIIPMSNMPVQGYEHPRIIPIGIRGGAAKPTTGYAFQTIQERTRSIITQLEAGNNTIELPQTKARFQFYDRLLLSIIEQEGKQVKPIFSQLFRNNRMISILSFLNEQSKWWEEIKIFSRLPKAPFLRALFQLHPKEVSDVMDSYLPTQKQHS